MVTTETCTVYRSSLRGRRFMTRKAAVRADAVALIRAKYPSERAEYEDDFGRCTYPGFHWTELKRSDVLLRRVMRMVERGDDDGSC